jgi:hypothetical protein
MRRFGAGLKMWQRLLCTDSLGQSACIVHKTVSLLSTSFTLLAALEGSSDYRFYDYPRHRRVRSMRCVSLRRHMVARRRCSERRRNSRSWSRNPCR